MLVWRYVGGTFFLVMVLLIPVGCTLGVLVRGMFQRVIVWIAVLTMIAAPLLLGIP
jgi:hypothetical protein